MRKPIDLEEAEERNLVTDDKKKAIHTFSNGSEADGWLSNNCYECWFYPLEGPGGDLCAFEAAAFIGMVTPELARMFGWIQDMKYDKPDDHRFSWNPPEQCPFFHQRPDDDENGDTPPPPPDPDPHQLVLIADPTEDLALAKAIEQHVSSPELEPAQAGTLISAR